MRIPYIRQKTPLIEVLMFTRHLSTMIKAGITISESLQTLQQQTKSSTFKQMIEQMYNDVQNGQSLANALKKHPDSFSQFYVSLIEVSEASGTLEQNLDFITLQLTKSYNLHKKVKSAALYPTVVLTATVLVSGFISYFVLPQLVDFFQSFDVELPFTTKILLFISTLFRDHGLLLGIIFILGFGAWNMSIRSKWGKPLWDRLLLKLPIIGSFVSSSQMAQFSRNLGVLVKSGVPITRAVDVTATTLTNDLFIKDIAHISTYLTQGKNISSAIERHSFTEFSPLSVKMIGIGEKTGKVDEALLYLGDFYEEEIDNFTKNLTTILEPVLLLIIGAVVGFVALAIISPIYELSGSLR